MRALGYCRHEIPLRRRDGSVAAVALVDAEDYEDIASFKWYLGSRGYALRSYRDNTGRSRAEFMHRRLMGLTQGDGFQTDHINRDKLDNRRRNLRIVTQSENEQNKVGTKACSGVRGVHWRADRGKWWVRLVVDGRQILGGHYDTVEEAAEASARLRKEHHPCAP
jgi:hypothetical protein